MTGIRRRDLPPSLTRMVICRSLNMLSAGSGHYDKGHGTNTDYLLVDSHEGHRGGQAGDPARCSMRWHLAWFV